MTTNTEALVTYDVNIEDLAKIKEKCATLSADTPKGYEEVRVAIGALRGLRVAIEKRRVELKADALAFGRLVDSKAKHYTALISEIEDPLVEKKRAVDDEKARAKAEEEAAKLRALEAEIAANRARQEADAKAQRDAEEARLAEERRLIEIERAKLAEERRIADERAAAERAKAEAAQRAEAERLAAERAKIEAERRAVEAERQKAERAEFERQARIRAEKEAADAVERERVERIRREAELAALLPDLDKVAAFASAIRALQAPKVRSKKVSTLLDAALAELEAVAARLDTAVAAKRKAA